MIVCPKCGSKSSEKQFVGPFCVDCYEFKFKVPKRVIFKVCKKCEKIRIDREWKEYDKKSLEETIKSRFKGDFERIDYYLDSGRAVMYFKVEDIVHMADVKFEPDFQTVLCPSCSRRSGGYYESIIQLRGNRGRIKKKAELLIKRLRKKTFITKIEERKEGLDLFVGNSKVVFELMRELGIKPKISRKLFTQRKGKRLYRTTFAVRL